MLWAQGTPFCWTTVQEQVRDGGFTGDVRNILLAVVDSIGDGNDKNLH